MKRFSLFLAAILAAAALTGCKSEPKETEPVTTEAPATEAPTEAVTEKITEAQTEPQTEDSMNKTRYLKGLVKSSAQNSLTIQTERGKELTFDTTGADIQLASGIQTGSNVTVVYKGKIQDTDTSSAKVLMIQELAAGETPVTEGELMTEAEEADPNAGAGTIGGSIEDVNMNRLVILADDGNSYYFSMYGVDTSLVNGLKLDNYVTVEYDGDIYGPDLVSATAVYDMDPTSAEARAITGPTPSGEHSYVNGVLDDCTLGTVTITTDDGEQLTFNIEDATVAYANGIAEGNYITLECEPMEGGIDAATAKVLAVYDYSETTGSAVSDAEAEPEAVEPEEADASSDEAAVYDDTQSVPETEAVIDNADDVVA